MHEIIQEAGPSSNEPMRKKWQIAWVHNGNAGGSKRFAFEMVRNLSARGHVIDEFIVRGSESNEDYRPLTKPFVRTSSEVIMRNPYLSLAAAVPLELICPVGRYPLDPAQSRAGI